MSYTAQNGVSHVPGLPQYQERHLGPEPRGETWISDRYANLISTYLLFVKDLWFNDKKWIFGKTDEPKV